MSVIRWEPFSELVSLREAMDRLFEDSVVRPRAHGAQNGVMTVPMEIYQTDDEVVVRAPVPGVAPENLDINVLGDTLTIKGELAEKRSENAAYFLRELRYGAFQRSITLPVRVNPDQAVATFEHGVLMLRLPKAESAKPRQIKVGATGGAVKK